MSFSRYLDGSRVVYWDDSGGNLTIPSTVTASTFVGPTFSMGSNVQFSNVQVSSINAGTIINGTNTGSLQFTNTTAPAADGRVNSINITNLNQRVRPSYGEQLLFTSSAFISRTLPANHGWRKIAWSPRLKLYVAVAVDTPRTNNIMTSPDGITWTLRSSSSLSIWTIVWVDSLSRFIAIGSPNDNASSSLVSSDGITWTEYSMPSNAFWIDMAWSPQLNAMVVVGFKTGVPSVAYSVNGESWITLIPGTMSRWLGVCWSAELGLFVAVSDVGVITSPNGLTWTQRTVPAAKQWYSVAWSGEIGLFAAVSRGIGDTQAIMTSPDGITWTLRTGPALQYAYILWSPELSMFIASAEGTSSLVVSRDGVTWNAHSVFPSAASVFGMVWSKEQSKLVALNGTTSVLTSEVALPASQNTLLFGSPGYASINNSNGLISMSSMNISTAAVGTLTGGVGNISSINTNFLSSSRAFISTITTNTLVVDYVTVVSTSVANVDAVNTTSISTNKIVSGDISTNTLSSGRAVIGALNTSSIGGFSPIHVLDAMILTSSLTASTIRTPVLFVSTINATSPVSGTLATFTNLSTSAISTGTIVGSMGRFGAVSTSVISTTKVTTSTVEVYAPFGEKGVINTSLAFALTLQQTSPTKTWTSVASSADGTKLVAVALGDYIYTSTDSGTTWTPRTNVNQNWASVASSADGTKLVAVVYQGWMYTSTDSGVTWNALNSFPTRKWTSVASSADGMKLVAVVQAGYIYTYTTANGGVSWTETVRQDDMPRNWSSVASSADGTKLVAVDTNDGAVYISDDSGVNWIGKMALSDAFSNQWFDVVSSADGMRIVVVEYGNTTDGGYIYLLANRNINLWITGKSDGIVIRRRWRSVASSADGMKLVAVASNNQMYTSLDGGVTWTARDDSNKNWGDVALSADGMKVVAAVLNGQLYTGAWYNYINTTPILTSSISTGTIAGSMGTFGGISSSAISTGTIVGSMGTIGGISTSAISTGTIATSSIELYAPYGEHGMINMSTAFMIVPRESSRNWKSVTSSADGMNLVAVEDNGYIYRSTDGGVSWNPYTTLQPQPWSCVASSAYVDSYGAYIVIACVDNGGTYISYNSGDTWNPLDNLTRNWSSVAVSADGNKAVAVVNGGKIYTLNPQSDASWTEIITLPDRDWTSVAVALSEIDQQYIIIAAASDDNVYISLNFGDTWEISAGVDNWKSVASSTDGQKLVAAVYGGYIYTSTDGGITWPNRNNESRNWTSVASSADGTRLVAVDEEGWIYTSTDSGLTWTELNNYPTRNWQSVASSADGLRFVAVDNPGQIYTGLWYNYINIPPIKTSSIVGGTGTFGGISTGTIVGSMGTFGGISTSAISTSAINTSTINGIVANFSGVRIMPTSLLPTNPDSNIIITGGDSTNVSGRIIVGNGTDGRKFHFTRRNGATFTTDMVTITDTGLVGIGVGTTSPRGNLDVRGNILSYTISTNGISTGTIVGGLGTFNNLNTSVISTKRLMTSSIELYTPLGTMGTIMNFSEKFTITQCNLPIRNWQSVASSEDGTKLVAVISGGYIYTSTDRGVNWTYRLNASSRNWKSVASSADGTKLVAVVPGGWIYTSTDSGETWTERASYLFQANAYIYWQSVASSADGTKLVAVVNGGYIYTSTDSGQTWTSRLTDSDRSWYSVASSADGTKLVAVIAGGYIYTSDGGVNWTPRLTDSTRFWMSVASSGDGTKLVAVTLTGEIWTSLDSGVSWTARSTDRQWLSVTSSADGMKLIAMPITGQIWTSSDRGVNWSVREETLPGFKSIASSADGTKFVGTDQAQIYIGEWNSFIQTTGYESELRIVSSRYANPNNTGFLQSFSKIRLCESGSFYGAGIQMAVENTKYVDQAKLQFTTGSQNNPNQIARMTIDFNGNVGIGTTSPEAKLHVNGNIIGSSFVTHQFDINANVSYPDRWAECYVFNTNDRGMYMVSAYNNNTIPNGGGTPLKKNGVAILFVHVGVIVHVQTLYDNGFKFQGGSYTLSFTGSGDSTKICLTKFSS